MDMQGSDHAPCWADWDLQQPLPTPETAPALSTRYMFTGETSECRVAVALPALRSCANTLGKVYAFSPAFYPSCSWWCFGLNDDAGELTCKFLGLQANSAS